VNTFFPTDRGALSFQSRISLVFLSHTPERLINKGKLLTQFQCERVLKQQKKQKKKPGLVQINLPEEFTSEQTLTVLGEKKWESADYL